MEAGYDPHRVLWLQNGYRVHRCVWELVHACERSGIHLEVVDGDVIPSSTRAGMVTEGLLEDLRLFRPGVVWILENTACDAPDRRF